MTLSLLILSSPLYFGFLLSTTCVPTSYLSSLYGPEPMTLAESSTLFAGKTFGSTNAPSPPASSSGMVWSGVPRVKVTLLPCAVAFLMLSTRLDGPLGSLILAIRLNVNATAAASSGSPLEKVRPGRIVQVYAVGVVYAQLCAASGVALDAPGATAIRCW